MAVEVGDPRCHLIPSNQMSSCWTPAQLTRVTQRDPDLRDKGGAVHPLDTSRPAWGVREDGEEVASGAATGWVYFCYSRADLQKGEQAGDGAE